MAQATAIRLTGDDLRIEDVWAVAFGDADAALSDEARAKMRAARELVERAAHGTREHTYGINTGFGRFVSRSIPEEQTDELLLECVNRGVLPHVPSRGSVGASGDLAPLAHLALPLVAEGEAWYDG